MTRRKKEEMELSDLEKVATSVAEETSESESTSKESTKNPHAVALGRLGGKKSAKARLEKLTPEQRKEIARIAAKARWAKRTKT
jgi:uncharacterized OB-fold protein